jgi:hypothetical protein
MNDKASETLLQITDDAQRQSAQSIFDWLAENKISLSGKFKDKRWGSVDADDGGNWRVHINVQYDEYLDEFLSPESDEIKTAVRAQIGHMGCGRCKTGKCAYTGADFTNPDETEIAFLKRLIAYRIAAIKDGRIPKCSYIKISNRGEPIPPCAVHKVCDPKCRAMKNF